MQQYCVGCGVQRVQFNGSTERALKEEQRVGNALGVYAFNSTAQQREH